MGQKGSEAEEQKSPGSEDALTLKHVPYTSQDDTIKVGKAHLPPSASDDCLSGVSISQSWPPFESNPTKDPADIA